MRILLLFAILFSYAIPSPGQKNIINQSLFWINYKADVWINKKSFLQSELHERRFFNPGKSHQRLARLHYHRLLGGNWDLGIGMCYFLQFAHLPDKQPSLCIPEIRPHIEFNNIEKLKKLSISHRYKVESRFFHNTDSLNSRLTNGFEFGNYRYRYKLQANYPIIIFNDSKQISAVASEEILINIGRNIIKNNFDNNRIFIGINYKNGNTFFETGYQNWFQQRSSGTEYFNRNIFILSISQKFKSK